MTKISPFICPFCGSHNTQILATSVNPTSAALTGISIDVDMECDDCEEEFTDFYDAEYSGYLTRDGVYDEKGVIVPQKL